ncbi:hypothetical protein Tco_1163977 [Tanacetum coccineum]
MSDFEHSTVTYTSVPFLVEDDSDIGSPGVDGPPIMPEDPYAYIPGPEIPPSPDYIPGPEEPQSPPPLDFVPEAWSYHILKFRSIPCSPECKIVGKILLDHPLSYDLTATADVPVVIGYQGVVDKVSAFYTKNLAQPWQTLFKKKEAIQYPRFIKLMIADLMKKFPNIPQRIDEDYHSIKDDIPLVSVYTTGNVLVRGMLIPDEFLTKSTPKAYRTPTVTAASPQGKKRKQTARESSSPHKSLKITIKQKQVVEGEKDNDDSEDRLEPGSHKENPKHVDDDDDDEEKVDEIKDADMGSLETRTEEMQTPIPTPPRSPRTILSSDKNITQELTDIVPLPTVTTSKNPHSKRRISSKYSHLPVDQVLHTIVPQLSERATDDLIENNLKPSIAATISEDHDAFRSEVPDLISQEFKAQAPKIIEELFKNYVQSNVIQVHLTKTTSTKTTSSVDLQQRLDDDIHSQRHDDHQEDDAPPEGEKRVKRHKASKSLKSARGSSSTHSAKDSITYVFKQQQQQQEWDAWVEEIVTDEDEVLKEVKLKIFQSEPWKKPPLLGELDRDIMRTFEREIAKRLNEDPSAGSNQEEPVFEIALDDVEINVDDEVGDAGQPPHTGVDETQADAASKIPKKDWFKNDPQPETLDPDWNTVKTIDDALEQSWFNEMECYRMLVEQLDWANPEGHKSPVDMSNPLPLQDKEGRLTILVEFFFNNDLEYLKAGNKKRTYSSSITKTPAARYTLEGIEDMIPTLWSPVIVAYDKDDALGISH